MQRFPHAFSAGIPRLVDFSLVHVFKNLGLAKQNSILNAVRLVA